MGERPWPLMLDRMAVGSTPPGLLLKLRQFQLPQFASAQIMNDFGVFVSEHLPRLNVGNEVVAVEGEFPDECIIRIQTTFKALRNSNANKALGPDNTPVWVLKDHADLLVPPLTAIFNCSLREDKLPNEWKMANIIPLPKVNPTASIYKYIRPISLTPGEDPKS